MSQISYNIGRKLLKKRSKNLKRDKSLQTFETAKQAIIIFDALLPNCMPPIKEFTKFLSENNISSSVIGYVSQKEVPQEMLLWANYDFINKKDLNWYHKPVGQIANVFYAEEPDMLFSLNNNGLLPVEFLAQLSKAKFKVGCYTEEPNDYDLMINPSDNNCDIGFFIDQVKHYIQILNPSK